jgi:hypothetical protein
MIATLYYIVPIMMQLITIVRIVALITLPIICFTTAMLTQYMHKLHFNPHYMSYLNSYSTGMILSMTLVRFVPLAESITYSALCPERYTCSNTARCRVTPFPWGFFGSLVTYLFFLFVDQIVSPHAMSDKQRVSKKMVKNYNRSKALQS